jgi:hypothetical protein
LNKVSNYTAKAHQAQTVVKAVVVAVVINIKKKLDEKNIFRRTGLIHGHIVIPCANSAAC